MSDTVIAIIYMNCCQQIKTFVYRFKTTKWEQNTRLTGFNVSQEETTHSIPAWTDI